MNMQAHLETLRARVKACPVTQDELTAAASGAFSSSWLNKFSRGEMQNPRINSLDALESALAKVEDAHTRAAA